MMDVVDIEDIVSKLTPKQVQFLNQVYSIRARNGSAVNHRRINGIDSRVGFALERKGLLHSWTQSQNPIHEPKSSWHEWALTDLGMTVKEYLFDKF